ncbi:MAG: GAF domain-containing protein [Anaerolineales bacterium]
MKLKRMLGAGRPATVLIHELIEALGAPLSVQDTDGAVLLGAANPDSITMHPIKSEGELLGWVVGGPPGALVARLLDLLASKETEKRALAREVLDRYRELNLLYNLAEKLAASLELKPAARVTLEEAQRLIRATGGSIMLLNDQTEALETIAAFGQAYQPASGIKAGEGIVGDILQTMRAEIVNDVWLDARHVAAEEKIGSLICAPLKGKQQAIGVLTLVSATPVTYTANDLKLLSTLAAQASPVIENALLYETALREAREREEKLQRQIDALSLELDEARQR